MAKIGPNGRVLKAVKKEEPKQEAQQEPQKHRRKREKGIDLAGGFEHGVPPQDVVLPGLLRGVAGALIAPGSTGKSWWALQAAMAVACGSADLLGIKPDKTGKVLYIAGEDPETEILRRVHSLGAHFDAATRKGVVDNLRVISTLGREFNIMDDETLDRLVEDTVLPIDEIMDTVDTDEMFDHRLIIFDTLSRIHYLDENSNTDMSRLLRQLDKLADRTRAAVIYLHHVNKGSSREGQTDQQFAARGASVLIDNIRCAAYVAKMTPDEAAARGVSDERRPFYVRYGVSKQSYGLPIHDVWLKRIEGGVLVPADDLPDPAKPKKKEKPDKYDYQAAKQGIKRGEA